MDPLVLSEHVSQPSSLRVDEEAGIIYGVRVLGRYSPNCHGQRGVTKGTEYTAQCHKASVSLYEGAQIYADHPATPGDKTRTIRDIAGVLRDPYVCQENGDTITRANLHYIRGKDVSNTLVEEAKRGLGAVGLSHNAVPSKSRIENGRLLIEGLAQVKSVDVVTKPATSRNLMESVMDETTPPMADTAPAAPVDAQMGDPGEMIWSGFKSAIMAVLDGEGTSDEKLTKIQKYLKAHHKLSKDSDMSADGSDDMPADDTSDDMGDMPSDEESDDYEEGEPVAKESVELAQLRSKVAVMELCESLDYKAPAPVMKALLLLESEQDRRELIEASKPTAKPATTSNTKPRSTAPRAVKTLQESINLDDPKAFAAMLIGH